MLWVDSSRSVWLNLVTRNGGLMCYSTYLTMRRTMRDTNAARCGEAVAICNTFCGITYCSLRRQVV